MTEILNKKEHLSSLEEQFVDLSRISIGKDTIIASQREEVNKLNAKLTEMERQMERSRLEKEEMDCRMEALNGELKLLQSLSTEQTFKGDLLEQMKQELNETHRDNERSVTRLEHVIETKDKQWQQLSNEKEETENNLEMERAQNRDLHGRIESLEARLTESDARLADLEPLAQAVHVQDATSVCNYSQMVEQVRHLATENDRLKEIATKLESSETEINAKYTSQNQLLNEVTKENTVLTNRNKELEKMGETMDEQIRIINQRWTETMAQKQTEWKDKATRLETELNTLSTSNAHLNRIVEQLSQEAAINSRRAQLDLFQR